MPWPQGQPVPAESPQVLELLLTACEQQEQVERAEQQPPEHTVPRYQIAGIVAGEVTVVPSARLAVACTALRDWRRGRSLAARWYGWSEPRSADYSAVESALSGACWRYPYFRFVGNDDDWETWKRLGWVEGDPLWRWVNGEWVVVASE